LVVPDELLLDPLTESDELPLAEDPALEADEAKLSARQDVGVAKNSTLGSRVTQARRKEREIIESFESAHRDAAAARIAQGP